MKKRLQQILNFAKAIGKCTARRHILLLLLPVISNDSIYGVVLTTSANAASPNAPMLHRFTLGQVLYLRQCADCHGWEGRGDGPLTAILKAKPRNFRDATALFTQNSDAQIVARILYGIPLMAIHAGRLPYSEDEKTALVTYVRQLPTMNWAAINSGKDVYDSLCAACHGLYGRGDGLAARSSAARLPDLAVPQFQRRVSDDALINSITNGIGTMPGAGDVLTTHEIRSAVTFLRVLSPGYELYSRFCAHCHGVDGVPPTVPAQQTGTHKVPPRLDAAYVQAHMTDQIRSAIQHMGREPRPTMPHLARQLNAEEAFAIVRYVRTLSSPTSQEDIHQ